MFWLSIAAGSIIRWAENSNFVAAMSKPHEAHPKGDNQDFRLSRAFPLFFGAVSGMFFFDAVIESIGLKNGDYFFDGHGPENSFAHVNAMLISWYDTMLQHGVWAPLLTGTMLRALIYKRSHAETD